MDKFTKVWIAIAVVAVVALGGYFYPAIKNSLGGEGDTNLTNVVASGGIYGSSTLTVQGAVDLRSTLSITGALSAATTSVGNLVYGNGVLEYTGIATSTPTSTLTAAQICGNGVIHLAPNPTASITTGTVALPVATSTNATCLTANGQSLSFLMRNTGGTTSTIGLSATTTGNTLVLPFNASSSNSANSITGGASGAGNAWWVTITRDSATSDYVQVQKLY